MSGLELLAVVGCVAAVISAYKDGSELVHKLQARRAQKRALRNAQVIDSADEDPETEELEDSLTQGQKSVSKRYDRDYRILGDTFATGDQVARDQLKDIIIHLQGQVITNLKYAWQEDSVVNFQQLQFVSDDSQVQTIHCLIDLHKRLLVAAPVIPAISPVPNRYPRGFVEPEPFEEQNGALSLRNGPRTSTGLTNTTTKTTKTTSGPPPVPVRSAQRTPSMPMPDYPGANITRRQTQPAIASQPIEVEPKSNTRQKIAKIFSRSPNTSSVPTISQSYNPPHALAPPYHRRSEPSNAIEASIRGRSGSLGTTLSNTSDKTVDSLEHNPWAEMGETAIDTTPSPSSSPRIYPNQSGSTHDTIVEESSGPFDYSQMSPDESPDTIKEGPVPPTTHNRYGSMSGTRTSISTNNRSFSLRPTRTGSSSFSGSTQRDRLPNENNKFRGLCKSAFRYQTDHRKKAIKIARRPVPGSISLTRPYWTCTECDFEGLLARDANSADIVDPSLKTFNIVAHPAHRESSLASKIVIYYRWAFLFRSHIKTKEPAQPQYSCVFCCCDIQAGFETGPVHVFKTPELLLAHIAKEHVGDGKWPDGEVLYRMGCAIQDGEVMSGVSVEGCDILLSLE